MDYGNTPQTEIVEEIMKKINQELPGIPTSLYNVFYNWFYNIVSRYNIIKVK